ncbi:hypothetical protein K4A83_03725 [Spirulina subsalsa FACHB-351]|uniref:Uncharacterized protein n=1 Tax=Spirulina subsalsa FACHB-351 TaxID=234711 RepID=A0ABT3L1P5_9CYAN|nr:hypothetical protein [Spirulina subsalsa]MCW6035385.1 hypothetical protein [Spirulina subsalsa FACHB-351]
MSPKTKESHVDVQQAQTRLLLYLWDMDGKENPVKRGELNKRLGKYAKDYQSALTALEESGAIETIQNKRSVKFALTDKGLQELETGLQSPDFVFVGNQVGTKVPNALLRWLRGMKGGGVAASQKVAPKISKYDEFKSVVFAVYDELNQGYNLGDLVPIYRIRREIGDRTKRTQFNDWLVKMQADDLIQLMAGEMPDMTPDKQEDSITLTGGAFRYYVKRLG